MPLDQWLALIVVGGVMGLIGQALRTAVGLKKLSDEASHQSARLADLFRPNVMATSLIIGFACGVVAILMVDGTTGTMPGRETLLGLVAAGYGGTDFIEGFAKRYLPSRPAPQGS